MFEPASPTMPGAFSPAAEPYGARRNNVYHPPTPSTAPQTPSTLSSSSFFFQQTTASPAAMSRQNENQRPLFVNRKRSRQDTVTGAPPQLQHFGQDNDTIMRSRNASSNYSNYDTAMGFMNTSRNVSSTFNPDIPPSPMPFVNTQYALKGGLDTPTAQRAAYFEGDGNTESEFSDVNYRRTLATGRRTASGRHIHQGPENFEREYHSFARLPSSASLESNGRPRIASPPNQAPASPGWGNIAGGLAGGVVGGVAGALGTVVGKVWQFCKAGAFSGFNAGGGEGYNIGSNHTKDQELTDDYSTTQIEFPDPPPAYSEAPLSEYREPDESGVMVDYPTPEPTAAQRPAKRRQISHEAIQNNNDAAIERSWVVVPIPSVPSSPAPAAPSNYSRNPRISNNPLSSRYSNASSAAGRRPQSALASPARSAQRRPMMHQRQSNSVSSTGSPRFIPPRPSTATASYASPTLERPSTASYANPRSSFGAFGVSPAGGYQSRLPRPATPGTRSGASTPTQTPTRSQIPLPASRSGRNSVAGNRHTPRSSIGGAAVSDNTMSPAAIEAKKWREQKKKEEAEEDIAMKRLNKQLQDMIREGQAALGTRFEVRDGGDEEMDDY